jgi:transcriptional regulator with XRE-family HTH domain
MRGALARRDIPAVYRMLTAAGVTQKRIGELTGQRQSEVSRVVHGGPVQGYDVLVRIADGFGVPRGWLGLAYDVTSVQYTPAGQEDPLRLPAYEEVSDEVKRRALLAAATIAIADRPVLGALVALDHVPAATPLPTQVGQADVAALHALTEQFRALGRAGHGVPEMLTSIAHRAERLLAVPADDMVKRALLSQLADLHTLAGWWCTDALWTDSARHHFSRALKLAADAGDVLAMVSAVTHAAHMDREGGAPDDALKLYQLAQVKLGEARGHPDLPAYQASLHVRSAYCWALLGRPDGAGRELALASELPPLGDRFERAGSDAVRSYTELAIGIGRIEYAERYAAASVRTYSSDHRREFAYARIALATTHTVVGDSDAPKLTVAALDAVKDLPSALARANLAPLEKALVRRKDSTSVDLAERARSLRTAGGAR